MAGYSGRPLSQKLGVKAGSRLALLGAPEGFEAQLAPLPDGVEPTRDLAPHLDVAVVFVTHRHDLARRFPGVAEQMDPAGGLWVAWPKRASKVETDLTENVVRELALAAGWVDNKVCAIDDVWSGLRLVRRLRDRHKTGRSRSRPPD